MAKKKVTNEPIAEELQDLGAEVLETTETAEAVEAVDETPQPTAEPVDYGRPSLPQPAEDMATYGTQWVYLRDLVYAGNVRTAYTGLQKLAASIMEKGMVARAVVVQPKNDCINPSNMEYVEYGEINIVLNEPHTNRVHILDAHRRTLALLLAAQEGINFVVGTDEYENDVIENIKISGDYRVPIALYTEKINNAFARKLIQYEFSKSEDINQYDLLNLTMEAACTYYEDRECFAKSRDIKYIMGSHIADQAESSQNNFLTAVRNTVRFIFGGEENMPRNPETLADLFSETAQKFMLLLENNHVAVSSIGHALKSKVKQTKEWAVTLEDMVEFLEAKLIEEGLTPDLEVLGNPTVSKKTLVDWVKGKTQIAQAELDADIQATKDRINGVEPSDDNTALTDDVIGDDGMEDMDDISLAIDDQSSTVKVNGAFAELADQLTQYAITSGQTVPDNYKQFLEIADNIEQGNGTIKDLFVFFKQDSLADLVDDGDDFDEDLDFDLGE